MKKVNYVCELELEYKGNTICKYSNTDLYEIDDIERYGVDFQQFETIEAAKKFIDQQ